MTTVWRMTIILVVAILGMAINPSCVFACSCGPLETPEAARARAEAVFAGRVTAIDAPGGTNGLTPFQVTFAVTQRWKAADRATVVVETPTSSASCGVEFVVGQEYLVYAQASDGQLQTNLCSRTAQLAQASADVALLGTGKPPASSLPTTLPTTGGRTTTLYPQSAFTGSALLLITIGFWVVVKQRKRVADQGK